MAASVAPAPAPLTAEETAQTAAETATTTASASTTAAAAFDTPTGTAAAQATDLDTAAATATAEAAASAAITLQATPSAKASSNEQPPIADRAATDSLAAAHYCRSCGKSCDDLYDLFQTSVMTATNSLNACGSMDSLTGAFTTASTTCYTSSATTAASESGDAAVTLAAGNRSLNTNAAALTPTSVGGFDSVAATAKATAKGQSNMENILQEMQIWHLQIKCNDGLPQRICSKCTAQFYMIHKFRRKCVKVQAQLRSMFEQRLVGEDDETSLEQKKPLKSETKPAMNSEENISITESMESKKRISKPATEPEAKPAPETMDSATMTCDLPATMDSTTETNPASETMDSATMTCDLPATMDSTTETQPAPETVDSATMTCDLPAAMDSGETAETKLAPETIDSATMTCDLPAVNDSGDAISSSTTKLAPETMDSATMTCDLSAAMDAKETISTAESKPAPETMDSAVMCDLLAVKDSEETISTTESKPAPETVDSATMTCDLPGGSKNSEEAISATEAKPAPETMESGTMTCDLPIAMDTEETLSKPATKPAQETMDSATMKSPRMKEAATETPAPGAKDVVTQTDCDSSKQNTDAKQAFLARIIRAKATANYKPLMLTGSSSQSSDSSDTSDTEWDMKTANSSTKRNKRLVTRSRGLKLTICKKSKLESDKLSSQYVSKVESSDDELNGNVAERHKRRERLKRKRQASETLLLSHSGSESSLVTKAALKSFAGSVSRRAASRNASPAPTLARDSKPKTHVEHASQQLSQRLLQLHTQDGDKRQASNDDNNNAKLEGAECEDAGAQFTSFNSLLDYLSSKSGRQSKPSKMHSNSPKCPQIAEPPQSSNPMKSALAPSDKNERRHALGHDSPKGPQKSSSLPSFLSAPRLIGRLNASSSVADSLENKNALFKAQCKPAIRPMGSFNVSDRQWQCRSSQRINSTTSSSSSSSSASSTTNSSTEFSSSEEEIGSVNPKEAKIKCESTDTNEEANSDSEAARSRCSESAKDPKETANRKKEHQHLEGLGTTCSADDVIVQPVTAAKEQEMKVETEDSQTNGSEALVSENTQVSLRATPQPEEAEPQQITPGPESNDRNDNTRQSWLADDTSTSCSQPAKAATPVAGRSNDLANGGDGQGKLILRAVRQAKKQKTESETKPLRTSKRKRGKDTCEEEDGANSLKANERNEKQIRPLTRTKRYRGEKAKKAEEEEEAAVRADPSPLPADAESQKEENKVPSSLPPSQQNEVMPSQPLQPCQVTAQIAEPATPNANSIMDQKLLIRVPLTSLTQNFKQLHLAKEKEMQIIAAQQDDKLEETCMDSNNCDVPKEPAKPIENISDISETPENRTNPLLENEENLKQAHSIVSTSQEEGENHLWPKLKTAMQNPTDTPIDCANTSDPEQKAALEKPNDSQLTKLSAPQLVFVSQPQISFLPSHSKDMPSLLCDNKANSAIQQIPAIDIHYQNFTPLAASKEPITPSLSFDSAGITATPDGSKSFEISPLDRELIELVQSSQPVAATPAKDFAASEPPFCGASSKITDFINDFQANCINSPDMEDNNTMDGLSPLHQQQLKSQQQISDEIRDVEDTLNGLLNEMHDRDMYTTPRSGENEEFLAQSIYSPVTDLPNTPSHQSIYAESPRTMNSNPMSLSPFIASGGDYNALTPLSNHSSCMSHSTSSTTTSTQAASSSTHPQAAAVLSENFPSYTECFPEENAQSELIGFQNDIPCFQTIELTNNAAANAEATAAGASAEDLLETLNSTAPVEPIKINIGPDLQINDIVTFVDKNQSGPVTESMSEALPEAPVVKINHDPNSIYYEPVTPHSAQDRTPAVPMTTSQPPAQSDITAHHALAANETIHPPPKFVLTNTPHGPIYISTPLMGSESVPTEPEAAHNIQVITVDENNSATTASVEWTQPGPSSAPAQASQQTPTLYVNAAGELYIGNPTMLNTLLVSQPSQGSGEENLMQFLQNPQMVSQQQAQQQNGQQSQYIMLLNNMPNVGPQFLANTHSGLGSQTLLLPGNGNIVTTQSLGSNEIDLGSNMPTFSISTAAPTVMGQTRGQPPMSVRPTPLPKAQKPPPKQRAAPQPRKPANGAQKINLVCRFCHKRPKFTNNMDYSNHIITMHPAEKPFNCDYCPKHFVRRSERQEHVSLVHGSRYVCAQCGVSFCAQRALDFHLQKYHASSMNSAPLRIATVAPTQSAPGAQLMQQNSTSYATSSSCSSSSSSSASSASSTASLSPYGQPPQRLVLAGEGPSANAAPHAREHHQQHHHQLQLHQTAVHKDESLQKCGDINIQFDVAEVEASACRPDEQYQPALKLCCPDCNGEADSCCTLKNAPQNPQNHKQLLMEHNEVTMEAGNIVPEKQQYLEATQYAGQSETDSTASTLRNFRKNTAKAAGGSPAATAAAAPAPAAAPANIEYYSVDKYISREMYNCHLCEEAFATTNALRKHRNAMHNNNATMPHVCHICQRGFRARNALSRHMETHDAEGRPFECNICQVRFPRAAQLSLHKLTVHKFEKVHTCEECGKQFATESSLKAHEKVAHEANSMPLPFACVYLEAPKTQKANAEQNKDA